MEEEPLEFPDIHSLFVHYNELYFEASLGAVSVEWSKKMTLCAGLCEYRTMAGCRIKLSEPLLKYRPVSDMKNTLLHEMIHAYLFLSKGNKDREDHGPNFLGKARYINTSVLNDHQRPMEGYDITVYHSFHDEVEHYRTHVWSCQRCSKLIKRSMNRPPSHKDCRFYRKDPTQQKPCGDPYCQWHQHEALCGGLFEKIAQPEPPKSKATKVKREEAVSSVSATGDETVSHIKRKRIDAYFVSSSSSSSPAAGPPKESERREVAVVHCPICMSALPEDPATINQHLDRCLALGEPVVAVKDEDASSSACQQQDVIEIKDND